MIIFELFETVNENPIDWFMSFQIGFFFFFRFLWSFQQKFKDYLWIPEICLHQIVRLSSAQCDIVMTTLKLLVIESTKKSQSFKFAEKIVWIKI